MVRLCIRRSPHSWTPCSEAAGIDAAPTQKRAESDLVGRGALYMPGAQAKRMAEACGDQQQAAPAKRKPVPFGTIDEPVVEFRDATKAGKGNSRSRVVNAVGCAGWRPDW